jgi:hypothetical protein
MNKSLLDQRNEKLKFAMRYLSKTYPIIRNLCNLSFIVQNLMQMFLDRELLDEFTFSIQRN